MDTINVANLVIGNPQWNALMPMLIVALGAMASLLVGTFSFDFLKNRKLPVFFSGIITTAAAMGWLVTHWVKEPLNTVQGMVALDYFSSYFFFVLLSCTFLVLLAGFRYLENEDIHYSEYYSILLTSVFGMMCLAVTLELVTIFIALEIMSLGVYVLVGLRRFDRFSNEAAAKYFVMGGVASAIYLYGVAMVYGAVNTTNLVSIAATLKQMPVVMDNPILIFGITLIFVGFFFKVAVAPFHMWTPDVYEGAPIIVTSFMSTALKAAAFAALIRISSVFMGNMGGVDPSKLAVLFHGAIWWLALLTMVVGNLVALMQKNLKRMLAYSAIAHTGYLMLGILVGPKVGYSGILIYLVPYSVMNIGAFTVLALFSGPMDKDATIDSLTGIGFKRPFLGLAMTIFLLSLAGLPPMGGFIGKYFLFSAALEAGETLLVLLAVITSLISVYYYLRLVIYMYMKEKTAKTSAEETQPVVRVGILAAVAIGLCVFITLQAGIYPGKILHMAKKAATFLSV